ncbi:MAG: inorganic diphosphatase [Bacteroidetes bacterium]|nr:inorganic diphosphatase [Bacteroidota bacterium]
MKLPKPFTSNKDVNVIIETPFKSRNKFAYVEEYGLYKLKTAIPDGLAFPCDFGFIPGTKGADGDPLDVLVIIDDYTFPGCLIECKIIGVIKVEEQKEANKKARNDRFIGIPVESRDENHLSHINELNKNKIKSITTFLESYNIGKKEVRVIEVAGPQEALKLIKKQIK